MKSRSIARVLVRLLGLALLESSLWAASAGAEGGQANPLDWWSFKPVTRPALPKLTPADQRRVRNPIDAFVIAKQREQGLGPSAEADRRTLIRRLYFDLTGLPPKPEEVEAFHASRDPRAYEKLVDRLLDSPQYGERWARHWLDVVHYGDTHGYDKDRQRPNAWPYRDYVIRALNEDKPYSRFVQEQLAGDRLFPGTRDGIEALGFIAAGPWDAIGHLEVPETKIDGKIARNLDRDDMVATTMNTFNSLTVQCARCHHHKFDPVTQQDYYSLQAVFAALDRTDVRYFHDEQLQQRFARWQRERDAVAAAVAELEAPLKAQAGEKYATLTRQIEGASPAAEKAANASPAYGYHSAIASTQEAAKWVQVDLGRRVSIDRVVLLPCHDDFNGIGAGFGFPVRFKIEASDDPEFRSGVSLFWTRHDATFMNDFPNPGLRPFSARAGMDGIEGRHVRVTAVKLAPRKNDYIFALAELQVFDAGDKNVAANAPVTAHDATEAAPRWRKANLTDGNAPSSRAPEERAEMVRERDALLLSVADTSTSARLEAQRVELRRLEQELKGLPAGNLVYAGAVHNGNGNFRGTGGKPRPIQVLHRGEVTSPRETVGPGTVPIIAGVPSRFELPPEADEAGRRVALAQWITDPRNPLTWRSIVNRVWQYHFGQGIVDSANDFGHMGRAPTHPELLDWLAAEFRDGGQSLKQLHRLIVTSATYRQGSGNLAKSPGATRDADNRYLWHMSRRRLEAEAIRDAVLAVAGKLDAKMGGPGFQDFVVEKPEHSPHYQYHLHDPEDARGHRRSIYRFIVRSQPQPFMTTLDCADPSMSVDKRNETMTALQALALLNNQLMLTMASHFAARLEKEAAGPAAQMERAFQLALARRPTRAEQGRLVEYASQHGLANACRLIFNLNEFVFVD
jgi:hypothetical protein